MKYLVSMFFFILVFTISKVDTVIAYEGDAVIGIWLTQDKDSKIEIYKKGDKYYGKIIWLKEPNRKGKPKVDDKNPDPKKQDRAIMGLVILKRFVYDDDYEWEDGEIYDPKSGKTYSCNMELSKDKKTLEVRGYIGISLFGRTAVWTRSK
ncbi:DUF2147 domain-containing protein [Bacteroidota bacterium]